MAIDFLNPDKPIDFTDTSALEASIARKNGEPESLSPALPGGARLARQEVYKFPSDVGNDNSDLLHSVIFYINTRENTRAAKTSAGTRTPGSISNTGLGRPNEDGLNNMIGENRDGGFALGLLSLGAFGVVKKGLNYVGAPGIVQDVGALTAAGGALVTGVDLPDSLGANFSKVSVKQAIQLFVSGPPTAEYSANWENKDLGIVGGAFTQGRVSLGDIITDGEGDFDIPFTDKSVNLSQFINVGSAGARSLIQGAADLPGKIGIAGDLGAAFDLISGNTLNPYKEQLFQSMGFRKFGFGYKFIPRNDREFNNVMSIIQLFKYHMHPERNDNNYTLIYPSEFEIEYRYKDKRNENLSKIAPCALTDVKVSFGGQDSFTSFKGTDGKPVEINMQLSFAELEMLTRQGLGDRDGTGVSETNWRNTF